MSADGTSVSFRLGQAEVSRLARAMILSLVVHALLAGTWYGGKQIGLWERLHNSRFVRSTMKVAELLGRKPQPEPPKPRELELAFVEVSPAQATLEPPKTATHYSSRNSQAANPQSTPETGVPKIAGKQEEVVKTIDVPKPPEFVPLQPALPAKPAKEETEEAKPLPQPKPGDLALGKPQPEAPKETGQAPQARPRTIKEAMARQQNTQVPGEKMKQEGGVKRRLEFSSLDAKATPFGEYDAMLVEAISQRWFTLLDQRDYASDSRGKVVLRFQLHPDGRVSDMNEAQNTSSEVLGLICRKAVLDPQPYPAWPAEMRRLAGEVRNIQFTFYYH